jgi:hypothetical protein
MIKKLRNQPYAPMGTKRKKETVFLRNYNSWADFRQIKFEVVLHISYSEWFQPLSEDRTRK